MKAFIDSNKLQDKVFIHQMALNHAVMDYYSDIQRLKSYQEIGHINEVKIKAYETFWLLKRRPLQLKAQLEDDKWLYINEKFLLARIANFILRDNINILNRPQKRSAICQGTRILPFTMITYLQQKREFIERISLIIQKISQKQALSFFWIYQKSFYDQSRQP